MGDIRLRFLALAALTVLFTVAGVTAPAAGAHSDPAIIAALDEQGRYLELSDTGLDASIDRANADGIVFAWLDQGGDSAVAVSLADDYVEDLEEIGSRYRTVVVLTSEGFAASSVVYSQTELDAALDASFDNFRVGAAGRGLEVFADALNQALVGGTTGTTIGQSSGSDGGGGIGFGTIILGIAVIGGGFFLLRGFSNRRKAKRQSELDMEEDRAEIKEQLKNNADRVISLGDKVIAKADQNLIRQYEEASSTYQDVSQAIDGASTPEEVDALDDRIDHAEWQFEVIEAELDGLPAPRSPEERRAAEATAEATDRSGDAPSTGMPPPPRGRVNPPAATSPRTGRSYPRTTGSRRSRGGGLGGVLGGVLSSVVLGGGLGGGSRSRRSQLRSGGLGDVFGGSRSSRGSIGTSRGGGLGGGVLRRGGGSSSRKTRSTRRTSSGGRSRSSGRSRSRGGRSF